MSSASLFNPWPKILRQARLERGLTQDNAADRAGVAEITWNRWENGKVHPGHQVFAKLARGADLTEAELGFRYAQALADHYGKQLAAAQELDPLSDDASHTGERRTPAAGADRPASRPALIRGFSSQAGALWVDVHQLFAALGLHRAGGSPNLRPDDRGQPTRGRTSRSEP